MTNFHFSPRGVHRTEQTDSRRRHHRLRRQPLTLRHHFARHHIWNVQSDETLLFRRTIRETNEPTGLDATEQNDLSVFFFVWVNKQIKI